MSRMLRLFLLALACSAVSMPAYAETASVMFTRAYHVGERTRVVLETSRPIVYQMMSLDAPERLVLDMQDVKLDEGLKALAGKIRADDPYVKRVRMAYFKPGVVRVVFDLKTAVKPSLFTLVPMGEYPDRLVLDIFPHNAASMTKAEKPVDAPAETLVETPVGPMTPPPDKVEVAQAPPLPASPPVSQMETVPDISTPQNTPAPQGPAQDTTGILPAEPSGTLPAIVKTPTLEVESVSGAPESQASLSASQEGKEISLPQVGLAISTVLAACLLLLLL